MEKVHLEGYTKFRSEYYSDNKELFENLANGQSPHSMVITCSDSRVEPSTILSSKPGDLFVARNIGNIVPPYKPAKGSTQAAIEYAVVALQIEHMVILGHSACGACAHLYHEPVEGEAELLHVEEWLKLSYPAKNAAMLEFHADKTKILSEITEKNNIQLSIERLMTYPYIIDALEAGTIKLHGWWYNVGSAELEIYNYGTKQFEPAK